jgi:hypothetical protein
VARLSQSLLTEGFHIPLELKRDLLLQRLDAKFAGEDYAQEVRGTLSFFGSKDPQAGVRLLDRLPGSLRDLATDSLAKSWAQSDPVAASEWIADMPPGPRRDQAARWLVPAAADQPEAALLNARAIRDPALSSAALAGLFERWDKVDSAAIEQLALQAGFTPDQISAAHQAAAKKAEPSRQ